jgi:arylsulfatase A-like enzyme/Tfp pilus assembly protein PilF
LKRRAGVALLLAVAAVFSLPLAAQVRRSPARPARPNVLLITVDTLRADRLGAYGSKEVATPAMDGLARDSVVFERALSQVPLTLPSHAVILTGTYPFHNRVQDFSGQTLSPEFRTLAETFKQNGYATGAVVSSFVLDRSWGLGRGFDFYYDLFSGTSFLEANVALVERRADKSVDHALEWLKKSRNRPFFFWLHLYDPHSPYSPPEPFLSRYDSAYDGEVAYTDSQVGRLLTWLRQSGRYSNTLVVLLSDHGESLGEHGENEHGFFIYNSTLHVPLLVKPPAGAGVKPGRVASAVETVSVAPTILELAKVRDQAFQKQFQAPSLLAAAKQQEDERFAYSETFYPFSSFGWSPLRSLHTDRYHYIEAPTPELYELRADAGEKENLAPQLTAIASALKQQIEERVKKYAPAAAGASQGSTLSPEAAEKLRQLGYMSFRVPVSEEVLKAGLADPKDKLWEFNSVLKAADAAQAGDFATSRALLLAVREKEPKLYTIAFLLGENALKQEDWATAAAELGKCLELNPNFDEAMTALARALFALERFEEAGKWVDRAIEMNPRNIRAWYQKGWMLLKQNPDAAAESFQKVVSIQPNFALARRDLGILRSRQQRYTEAAEHLEVASKMGIHDPRLLNFLGIAYNRTNRPREAIAVYRRAIEGDPNLAEAHLNLAFAYQTVGNVSGAQQEYESACRLERKFCEYVPKR